MAFCAQVELAALPDSATQHGLAGGLQASMIVGGDEPHAAHAASDQVFQEGPPMDFGLGKGDGDAEDRASAIGADTDCREHGSIAHHATLPGFLVAGIQKEIADFAELTAAPGFELVIEQFGGPADLGR
jgi:hypothetical protein